METVSLAVSGLPIKRPDHQSPPYREFRAQILTVHTGFCRASRVRRPSERSLRLPGLFWSMSVTVSPSDLSAAGSSRVITVGQISTIAARPMRSSTHTVRIPDPWMRSRSVRSWDRRCGFRLPESRFDKKLAVNFKRRFQVLQNSIPPLRHAADADPWSRCQGHLSRIAGRGLLPVRSGRFGIVVTGLPGQLQRDQTVGIDDSINISARLDARWSYPECISLRDKEMLCLRETAGSSESPAAHGKW